jgi:hypothetical protein
MELGIRAERSYIKHSLIQPHFASQSPLGLLPSKKDIGGSTYTVVLPAVETRWGTGRETWEELY